MIVAVLAAIAVCMGFIFVDGTFDDSDSYSIEYVMNGATGDNPNPDRYSDGKGLRLMPCAYADGVSTGNYFSGWYLDSGLTQLCMEIEAGTSGDITLYAGWSDNVQGRTLNLAFDGVVKDGILNTYKVFGNQVITYRAVSEEIGGYYMTYETSTTYDHGFSQYSDTDYYAGWNAGDGPSPEVIGQETIDTVYGPKACNVYDSPGMRQWLGVDDDIIYKIVQEDRGFFSSKSTVFTLESSSVIPIVNEVEVTAYADNGITVTGSGTYEPMQELQLTATASEGYTFAGWFDYYGRLISDDPVIVLETEWDDLYVYALNDENPDYTTETFTETVIELNSGTPSPTWSIYPFGGADAIAEGTGDVLRHTFRETGVYEIVITDDATGYHGYRTLQIEGDVVRDYKWRFEGKDYALTLTMDYDRVMEYRNMLPVEERCQIISFDNADRHHEASFVTYKDPYIQQLAVELNRMSAGMSDLQRANFVLAFLQNIEYQSDEVYMHAEEYWKFPVETLYDMGGDCEDSSILYSAIVKAMGYDTALFLLPGHMMSSISIDGKVPGYYEVSKEDGKKYYYVETTDDNAKIGQKSPNMYNPTIIVIK